MFDVPDVEILQPLFDSGDLVIRPTSQGYVDDSIVSDLNIEFFTFVDKKDDPFNWLEEKIDSIEECDNVNK